MLFLTYDVFLVRTMWADYLAASGKNPDHVRVPEIWAAGVLMNFIQLNGVYSYTKAADCGYVLRHSCKYAYTYRGRSC